MTKDSARVHNRLFFIVFTLCLLAAESHAAPSSNLNEEPVFIEANDMHYDRDSKTVSAQGNVEIVQGNRIVMAQRVMYHEPSGTVYAMGDVSILEPDGNVYFAQKVQLQDDLKQGVINQFRARLNDNSLLASSKATQVNENVIELEDAVYSPCEVCYSETGKKDTPLWQLKARRVVHDKEDQRIRYHHARMELMGFPLLYSPYFSHATPDANRKSGILVPSYGVSTSLGTVIEIPYYINIASDMDATVTPMYASLESPVLKGEFRHLLPSGQYSLAGSITNPDQRSDTGAPIAGQDIRGHIEGVGHFALNDMWSWGFNAKRSSDDTYLRRYEISNEDMLTSRLYMEGFGKDYFDRTYASAEALSFQGLRVEDEPGLTPLVLPMVQFEHAVPVEFMDSRLQFSGNMLSITRDEASDSQRVSLAGEWVVPYQTPGGHLFTLTSALRGDAYYISGIPGTPGEEESDTVGRLIPEVALNWKYPLVQYDGSRKILLEPQVEVIASPNGNNPDEIPNNDSQSLEFSDTNLFSRNRYTGLDRVESGTRVNYGLTTQIQMASDAAVNLLFGQTYHANDDGLSALGMMPGDSFSDYIARIEWESEMLYLAYRARLDEESLALNRNEVNAGLNLYPFQFNGTYLSLDNDPNLSDRQEAITSASLNLTKEWILTANGHRDLLAGRWVNTGIGLMYQNECLTLLSSVRRAYYRDRDVEPATSYLLQLKLKNLN